ncbi:PhnB protein [Mobilisporobacter senegalensis]|uniref:PhnB protein n=1 Tax=Mobilisporobacter senegalensis TaxID=1329262 RepID=A0A3N1XHZ1_9FIRM|nr:VOC family protein [Mobilisporobacter senegalensis]ROR26329.1 PhnB protein [Mobilisporobacter senegalensis]
MSVIAYLNFDGNATQAIDFYSRAFESNNVKKVMFKDFPQDPNYPLPEDELNMIMESSLEFASGKIMMSDTLPSMKQMTGEVIKGNNMLISIIIDDKQLLEKYFTNLSVEGYVIMPLSNMPWSSCFGMLVDKFGITWKFNSDADKFLDSVIMSKS